MARKNSSARRASSGGRRSSASRKPVLTGFTAGAVVGTSIGLASTLLVMEFSMSLFPSPLLVILLSAFISLIMLIGGIIGSSTSRKAIESGRKR